MAPPKSSQCRAFWVGIAVGYTFRAFAYGLLGATFSQFLPRDTPASVLLPLYVAYALAIFCSPLWVPFVSGFLSAYSWRRLQTQQHLRAFEINAVVLLALALMLAIAVYALGWGAEFSGIMGVASVIICLDIVVYPSGAEYGTKFWNGRMGRQFLGDFSTRDDEENR